MALKFAFLSRPFSPQTSSVGWPYFDSEKKFKRFKPFSSNSSDTKGLYVVDFPFNSVPHPEDTTAYSQSIYSNSSSLEEPLEPWCPALYTSASKSLSETPEDFIVSTQLCSALYLLVFPSILLFPLASPVKIIFLPLYETTPIGETSFNQSESEVFFSL